MALAVRNHIANITFLLHESKSMGEIGVPNNVVREEMQPSIHLASLTFSDDAMVKTVEKIVNCAVDKWLLCQDAI